MRKDKFLTVFAIFDEDTQKLLQEHQNAIFDLGLKGTQTMGIPFHLTLGSFPVELENELKARIKEVCAKYSSFYIPLARVNHFNNVVLFAEPEVNEELMTLHNLFDNNYANGFPYHPHATIFCGSPEEVELAKTEFTKRFIPINAKIVGIEMGEFFPTRMIISEPLQNP